MAIDPTARVAEGARIGDDVEIGPYCLVGPQTEIKSGVRLVAHVNVIGVTAIGEGTVVYPFASLGTPPQSVHYRGSATRLVIGARCEVREGVTMNTGTEGGGGMTRVGERCLFMVGSHVGHDCQVGSDVTLANNVVLGGHVSVGDRTFLGGHAAVHQFVRIGAHSYIGGGTTITQDVLPFSLTSAERDTHAFGLNKVGLERRGFSRERIRKIHHAYKILLASKLNTSQALAKLKAESNRSEDVEMLIRFVETAERGVIK